MTNSIFEVASEFIEPVGKFALAFPLLERRVSWAVESALSLKRTDGNEFEGMLQSFAARIKLFDLCTRAISANENQLRQRDQIIQDLQSLYRLRNNLFHNSAVGVGRDKEGAYLMLKRLDGITGKEKTKTLHLSELISETSKIDRVTEQIRSFILSAFPDADYRVP